MNFDEYVSAFQKVEHDFENSVTEFGLEFESYESSARKHRCEIAQKTGFHLENNNASLWTEWISPACLACRTGEKTATFFVDLRCTKNCYFCFNPNQDNYEYFLYHERDIVAELNEAYAAGAEFDCLAVTGGEPLLHADTVVAFISRARKLYPQAHIRIYTNGDLLDETLLKRMAAGLTEIRFSIKPSDIEQDVAAVFDLIRLSTCYIPNVMVEVPVVPGMLDEMKDMLLHVDDLGVRGVNLLEMCFPFCNAQAFKDRGLKLRKHPFNVLYNYWYGGGIPVAQSESDALALMEFAFEKGIKTGVHYCSSDNKNTGQIYQQNMPFLQDIDIQKQNPWLSLDTKDWFIKCAKVFACDAKAVQEWLKINDCYDIAFDPNLEMLSFPVKYAKHLKQLFPSMRIGEAIHVLEPNETENQHIKEIWVREVR